MASVEEMVRQWKKYMEVERGLAPNSRKLYERYLQALVDELEDPLSASTDVLRAWLYSKGGSPRTMSNRITGLKSFYRYLTKAGVRSDNPAIELEAPKGRTRAPAVVSDLEAVLADLDKADRKANKSGSFSRRVGETRDMAMFLAETGMRIHEAVACAWPSPCPSEVIVVGKDHKEKRISVSPRAREAWDRLGGKWPVGARATQRRFEKAECNPQQFRNWYRTHQSVQGTESNVAPPPDLRGLLFNGLSEICAEFTDEELATVMSFLEKLSSVRTQ